MIFFQVLRILAGKPRAVALNSATMEWPLFFSTFSLIFLAELPDKTALATLMLAARNRAAPVFLGVAAAFVIQTAVAVLFGSLIGKLPSEILRWGTALLFFLFAFLEWKKSREPEESHAVDSRHSHRKKFWSVLWKSFLVIFVAEWGDLTQLATATIAAKSPHPSTIFCAAVAALWSVTLLSILVGKTLMKYVKPQTLQRIAAVVFLGVGIFFLIQK